MSLSFPNPQLGYTPVLDSLQIYAAVTVMLFFFSTNFGTFCNITRFQCEVCYDAGVGLCGG